MASIDQTIHKVNMVREKQRRIFHSLEEIPVDKSFSFDLDLDMSEQPALKPPPLISGEERELSVI